MGYGSCQGRSARNCVSSLGAGDGQLCQAYETICRNTRNACRAQCQPGGGDCPEDEEEGSEEEAGDEEAPGEEGEGSDGDGSGGEGGGESGSGGGGGGSGSGGGGSGSGSGGGGSGAGSGGGSGSGSGGGSGAGGGGAGPPPIPGWPPSGGGGGNTYNVCVGDGACSRGDPHLMSFDGVRFDFQGVGEYHFAMSKAHDIDVQVRYGPSGTSRRISVTRALAARVEQHRLTAVPGREPVIEINGEPLAVASGLSNTVSLESGILVSRQNNNYRARMPKGIVITFLAGRSHLNVGVVSEVHAVTGLGGSRDGDRSNEFTTRDGRPTAANRSDLTYDQLYKHFGDSWRIAQADSLFDYGDGESTATFTDLEYPELHLDLDDLDPEDRRRAEILCRDAGVREGADLLECIYDVGFTNDVSYVHDYLRPAEHPPATLAAPTGAPAGSTISVRWTGPGDDRDYIALSNPGDPVHRYETFTYIDETDAVSLTVPGVAGDYELRYVRAGNRQIAAAVPIDVMPVSATLDAPTSVPAGGTIAVMWSGPANDRDFISLARPDQRGDRYETYGYIGDTDSVTLRVPGVPGAYELRYVVNKDRQVVATRQLEVTAVTATLAAPDRVPAGSQLDVEWSGPANKQDFISLALPEQRGDRYKTYAYVGESNTVTLRVPGIPGDYELRYVVNTDRQVVATRPLEVTAVTATLAAPDRVPAGSQLDVEWTGPANRQDFISLALPEQRGDRYKTYAYVGESNVVTLRVPDEPGDYVLRYVLNTDRQVLVEVPVTVVPGNQ